MLILAAHVESKRARNPICRHSRDAVEPLLKGSAEIIHKGLAEVIPIRQRRPGDCGYARIHRFQLHTEVATSLFPTLLCLKFSFKRAVYTNSFI